MTDILDALRRRLPLVLLCGLIGFGVAAALALTAPESYRATARLFVATAARDVASATQGDIAARSRVKTYSSLVQGPALLVRAAERSGTGISAADLGAAVSVSAPPGTVLLDVTAAAGEPERAAQLAQAVADELLAVVEQLEKPLRNGQPSIGLLVLQPAQAGVERVPAWQLGPVAMYTGGGLAAGLCLAVLIPARFRFRRRRAGAESPVPPAPVAAAPVAAAPVSPTPAPVPSASVAPVSAAPPADTAVRPDPPRDPAGGWQTGPDTDQLNHVPRRALRRRRAEGPGMDR